MPINRWWTQDPVERYWLEITDRESLGSNLIAPKQTSGGRETWSYSLVAEVQPGDVVFHWWKRPNDEKAIVGYSTAAAPAFSSALVWRSHSTTGRIGAKPGTRPAWEVPLIDFTELSSPVTLDELRQSERELRLIWKRLSEEVSGPIYFPFAFSDKRPMRTAQGYLAKFPAAVVGAITELERAHKEPRVRRGISGTRGVGRQQDPAVRRAIEEHAVNWVLTYFDGRGFAVENVGNTESFDVLAIGEGDRELHIEVKGSATDSVAVELTDGEVQHWGPDFERVLVVVDRIKWTRVGDSVQCVGGRPRVWHDWELTVDAEELQPTRYRYTLPAGSFEVTES